MTTPVGDMVLSKLQKSIGLPVSMSDFDNKNDHLIADHDAYYQALEEELEYSKEHSKMFLQFLQRKGVDVQSLLEE
jgi:hypothetical protein